MGQIVSGIRNNKIGVGDSIVAVALFCLVSRGDSRSLLNRFDSRFASREAGKMFIEIVQPPAQFLRRVPCRIRRNKNELDLIGQARWQFLQCHANIRHVHGTLIAAIGVAEKEKRHRPLGSVPEIKRRAGSVSENKSRLGQRRRYETAPVGIDRTLLCRRQTRENQQ